MKDWHAANFTLAHNVIIRANRDANTDLVIAPPTEYFPRFAFFAQRRDGAPGDMLFTYDAAGAPQHASDAKWSDHG